MQSCTKKILRSIIFNVKGNKIKGMVLHVVKGECVKSSVDHQRHRRTMKALPPSEHHQLCFQLTRFSTTSLQISREGDTLWLYICYIVGVSFSCSSSLPPSLFGEPWVKSGQCGSAVKPAGHAGYSVAPRTWESPCNAVLVRACARQPYTTEPFAMMTT